MIARGRTWFLLCLLVLAPTLAQAQGTLLQAGAYTGGHVPMYVIGGNGQASVQDSGPAGGGGNGVGLSELGITARGAGVPPYAGLGTGPFGTNICDYDAPVTNATGYHYLCFSANAKGGGLIAYGNSLPAAPLPLSISVNGSLFTLPGSASCLGCGSMAGQNSNNVNITGGTIGPLTSLQLLNWGYVTNHGAKCDGVTDDTAAIAAAIAATPTGGTLAFPVTDCLVSGSGAQIFLLPLPIILQGAGREAGGILVSASVPSTTDILHFVPQTGLGALSGYSIRDLHIHAVGDAANVGQHVIDFDTTGIPSVTTYMRSVDIRNNQIYQPAGNSIELQNGINPSGGVQDAVIFENMLFGSIGTVQTGDSIRILHNWSRATNGPFVTVDQISGAGNFIIDGNNVIATGGCIILNSTVAPLIENNECEQQFNSIEPNNAIIDTSGNVAIVRLFNNTVTADAGAGNPTPIRLDHSDRASLNGNLLSTPTAYPSIVLTANASQTYIAADNAFQYLSGNVTDGGVATQDLSDPWKTYTPTVTAASGAFTSAAANGSWVLFGHQVSLTVNVNIITNGTANAAINATLPFTATSNAVLSGRAVNNSGKMLQGLISAGSNVVEIFNYDNTYPGSNGEAIVVSGIYNK